MVQSIGDARRRQERPGVGGRVPPHNLAAEESLLGAMLLSRDAIGTASLSCKTDDFYKPAHGHVFEAILALNGRGEPADPVTVSEELRRAGMLEFVGGPAALVTLQANTPATSNSASYAKIVEEHALLRKLIGVAGEIAELGYSVPDDVTAAIDAAEAMVFGVAERRVTDTTAVLRELLFESLERIGALFDRGEDITGVPTGYSDIDHKLSGLQKSTLVIVGARPAVGKALALGTPVPTPGGWTTMGEVRAGDEVFDEMGHPCRVVYASPVFTDRECYRVSFDDGSALVADADHQWFAYDYPAWKSWRERLARLSDGPPANPALARDQSSRYRKPRVVTTRQMLSEGVRSGGGHLNWYVTVAGALDLPDDDLPVDPYVLGCWLGRSQLPIDDADVAHFIAEFEDRGYAPSAPVPGEGAWQRRRPAMRGLARELEDEGIERGRIPARYLRASAKQRLELLHGVMDTSGAVTASGTVELALPDRALLAQVWELVASLGHKPFPIREGRFHWTPADPVFRIERKAAQARAVTTGGPDRRAVVAIERVATTPVRCIAVDSPSHLFLAGRAMIPTHNTAFALGMASHAAVKAGVPVLFFSVEMGHMEITQRLLCAEASVDSSRLRNGRLLESDWPRITAATSRLGEAPLWIDDNPNLTIMEVRAKARRLKSRLGGLGLIVIDYLQLMTGRFAAENRQVEISEMSRSLKILARELEVPIVALSQLSRALESRSDKRPMLSDLRESGCLTGDARVLRADTGAEVTMSELLVSGERDIPVWTVDPSLRIVPAVMTHVFPSGIKPVFALHLASGRTIKASANHPFLTAEGWRRLDELEINGRIATPMAVPPPAAPRRWREDDVVLLGHLLGDGTTSLRRPLQSRTADPAVLSAVRKAAAAFGAPARVRRQGNWLSVELSPDHPAQTDRVWEWLESLGLAGLRSREKFIPAQVAQLPNDQLGLFLRHLWASGGSLGWRAGHAEVSLVVGSLRLAEGVQMLLTRFGVASRVARAAGDHQGAPGWQVVVDMAQAQRAFLDQIGAFGMQVRRVPLLLTKVPAHAVEVAAARPHNQPSRDLSEVPTIGYVRTHGVSTVPDILPSRSKGDVSWDRIVGIEALGEEPVYDATVEGAHNFVANGISVHNSLEQDADVVMFIYRDEVYNPETNDKGMAEVIVAKHRNGPTGTSRLVFHDRYTRFANARAD